MLKAFVQGQRSEWALLRRHESEDIFGAQVCGHSAEAMTRCAELLCKETDLDFIDINVRDLLERCSPFLRTAGWMSYRFSLQKGRWFSFDGSPWAIQADRQRFETGLYTCLQLQGMSGVMDIPLTVKLRTGVYSHKPTAHKLTPVLQDWGAELITVCFDAQYWLLTCVSPAAWPISGDAVYQNL